VRCYNSIHGVLDYARLNGSHFVPDRHYLLPKIKDSDYQTGIIYNTGPLTDRISFTEQILNFGTGVTFMSVGNVENLIL